MENEFEFLQENVNVLDTDEDDFERLLAEGNVDDAKARMDSLAGESARAYAEYDPRRHAVNFRRDKTKVDRKGNVVGSIAQARLPVPYQAYINEVALVFLFGRPVMWKQESEGTDEAFSAFLEAIKRTHFDARIRQCKRIAGAELESAMLFRCYRDHDGQAALQLRVLAHSKGDEIYTRFDQYENLAAFAWGYHVKASGNVTEYHLDVFTREREYHCVQEENGWRVDAEDNIIGKIPVILFRQRKEWWGVEPLIEREERMASATADNNDYFSNPYMVITADVVQNLPDKEDTGKVLVTNDTEGGADKAAKFVTWDTMPASKQAEFDWLENHILSKSFTPDIKLDTLKSLGNLSGKALRTVMLLADIKAGRNKEIYDEMLDRTGTLLTSIIGNVLDVRLKAQCDALRVAHVWQEPFGEDVAQALEDLTKALDADILSQETAISLNPLVSDTVTERQRIEDETGRRQASTDSLFGARPASYTIRQATEREGGADNGE